MGQSVGTLIGIGHGEDRYSDAKAAAKAYEDAEQNDGFEILKTIYWWWNQFPVNIQTKMRTYFQKGNEWQKDVDALADGTNDDIHATISVYKQKQIPRRA